VSWYSQVLRNYLAVLGNYTGFSAHARRGEGRMFFPAGVIITGRAGLRRVVVAVISCVLAGPALAACSGGVSPSSSSSSAASPAATLPDTFAGAQARWLITAMTHLPIGAAEVRAHFDADFLAQLSQTALNQMLQGIGDVKLVWGEVSQASTPCLQSPAGECLAVTVSTARQGRLALELAADPSGLISGLHFGPVLPPATTWQGVDAAIRSVAPQVRLLAAEVTGGSCRPVHGIDSGTPAPLASAFKRS